ncbi:MAG TPA: AsmA-like C-terminal region-containing protein, partial [Ferruginibacter sp.]|nr:AsmA-like C-terminal region-containing protein [Ferruginibacter sp.]
SFQDGTAKLNLFYDGPVTKDRSLLAEMEGKLSVSNGTVEYVPRGFTFRKCNGDIEFYKDSIRIPGFVCSYLKNEIHIEAEGKNIRRNFLAGQHTRQPELKCIVRSPYLDLEDFKPLFAAKKQRVNKGRSKQDLTALSNKFDDLIENGIIRLLVKVADIRHQNLRAKNFEGDIRFGTGYWEIPDLSMNLSGGYIRLLGKIEETGNDKHAAGVKVKVTNVDVKKLFLAFDDFGLEDISHKNLQGNFSTTASINAGIDGRGKLVPESLSGTIDFSLKNGGLQNFAPLAHVKNYVFKKRNLEDVRFAEIKTRIDIKGSDMFINRMEIESNVFRLFLEGNYGLKGKNTDLLLQVPFSNFNKKKFSEEDMPVNKGIGKAPKNIWLRAKNNEEGKVKLTLTLNPKLKENTKKRTRK